MKRCLTIVAVFLVPLLVNDVAVAQQPADGENSFRLAAVNSRRAQLDADAGRGIIAADNPDLDGDGNPEILITNYSDGGRIFVFEVTGNDQVELVWVSTALTPGEAGRGSTPRSVATGDLDNNGRQEVIFSIGHAPAQDTLRGIYIFEHDGVTGSDNYGDEPVRVIDYTELDTSFASVSVGRTESGWLVRDIDDDGRTELVYCPRAFNFDVANVYILQVTGGEWRTGDAALEVEYEYTDMAITATEPFEDGYVPTGVDIGDIDADGFQELCFTGWTNVDRGGGVGFLQVSGEDTYVPGSVVDMIDSRDNIFIVKAKPIVVNVDGMDYLFIMRHRFNTGGPTDIVMFDAILDDQIIDESNITTVIEDAEGVFSIWAAGDQDHGDGSDGFEFYLSASDSIISIEYDGSGPVFDPNSYGNKVAIYDIDREYTNRGGLFNELYAFPGMDLDRDGNREVIASWKGSGVDTLAGVAIDSASYNVFVFEWGDSTASISLEEQLLAVKSRSFSFITPDDYQLEQSYPNPFAIARGAASLAETRIEFSLPVNKEISLKVYDMTGREVRSLIQSEPRAAGRHFVNWDGRDNSGRLVASGVYLYKLEFGNFFKSQTMTVVR